MRTRLVVVALAAALVASAASAQTRDAAIGTHLTTDRRHIVPAMDDAGGIILNIPQRMLFYRGADGELAFPVAVGRPSWPTPLGEFTVIEKRADPAWHVPPSIMLESERLGRSLPAVVPPGPENPLGKFWVGTSLPGIGIHGTNAPSSISRAVTHGCIRAGADDIRNFFGTVEIDTRGAVVYEPILLASVDGEIYVEMNSDVYHRVQKPPLDVLRDLAAEAGIDSRVDWRAAAAVVAAHEGTARRVTLSPSSSRPRPAAR